MSVSFYSQMAETLKINSGIEYDIIKKVKK